MLKDFIKASKALSDETRVRILKLLGHRELCVCQLMSVLGMGQSTVSKHLGILRNAGLVEVRKEWTWAFYKISEDAAHIYNRSFLSVLSSVLKDDFIIRKDEDKLREVIKKDIKAFCNTGEKR
ncbi:MAG: ArsR family transcriptional regulator [Nitrospiraceae bacterium]|nr:MAG: ArsR family transcriptional regulator [Nitrospiraceae bacterium]